MLRLNDIIIPHLFFNKGNISTVYIRATSLESTSSWFISPQSKNRLSFIYFSIISNNRISGWSRFILGLLLGNLYEEFHRHFISAWPWNLRNARTERLFWNWKSNIPILSAQWIVHFIFLPHPSHPFHFFQNILTQQTFLFVDVLSRKEQYWNNPYVEPFSIMLYHLRRQLVWPPSKRLSWFCMIRCHTSSLYVAVWSGLRTIYI